VRGIDGRAGVELVSAVTERSIELLSTRDEAKAFIADVKADEPELAALLRPQEIDLG
jgi:hypothetical protein